MKKLRILFLLLLLISLPTFTLADEYTSSKACEQGADAYCNCPNSFADGNDCYYSLTLDNCGGSIYVPKIN